MPFYPNPNRIRELTDPRRPTRAAETIQAMSKKEVLRAAASLWFAVLLMVVSLLLVVRVGLTLPLPWHG